MSHPELVPSLGAASRPAAAHTDRPALDPQELRLASVRALAGASLWHDGPAVLAELRLGALAQAVPDEVPDFLPALLAALPRLRAALGRRQDAALVSRRPMGALLPMLVQRLAVVLQQRAGCEVRFGRTIPADAGSWMIVVDYEEPRVGEEAVRAAVALVHDALAGRAVEHDAAAARLAGLFEDVRLGPSSRAIVEAARRRGIPVRRLDPASSLVQLGTGRHQRRVQAAVTGATGAIAVELAQDKEATKRRLESVGLPTPAGEVVDTLEEALAVAARIGFPVLLKPYDGNHGRGVSGRVADAHEVAAAWPRAAAESARVLVERFAEGRDHRVLVVGDRVVACAERVPAHVVGDGTRTVRELAAIANADPRRGEGHANVLTRLPVDAATVETLALAGRTLDCVPAPGERVLLRATANLSTGGTAIDRTDELHPDNARDCVLAARALGLDVAGIDVLSADVRVPFRDNGAVMIEVNAGPGLRMHTHPSEGTPRDVGGAIVDLLFPPGAPTRVPVLAVTGTNGKTTTTRLLAHLVRRSGRTVGFTSTDGVYLDRQLLVEGDMTGPYSAGLVLGNPLVDVAVLETARGGLLRAGLGFERCDVGVVLNVAPDHLGLRGVHTLEQLAEVKGVIARAVAADGICVLNADDPLTLAMRSRTRGRVALFSLGAPGANPDFDAHVAAGGLGAGVDGDRIVLHEGGARTVVATVGEVPLTLGGSARFQVQNVLAATLAAHAHGVPLDAIRDGLRDFASSPALTPGRMNLIRVGRAHVIVDYAHNPPAVEALLDVVRRFDARRRVGVVTVPGDRRDEDIRTVGRLCAAFDAVVVKEDDDTRGRAPGAITRLLHDGLREGGLADDAVAYVRAEPAAVGHALDRLAGGDLLVVLADDVPAVLAQVEAAARAAEPRA